MGSVAKVVKKASRVIKKPISKITKGIARGIAKVGKSVMKGVGRISKKLGPLGMIGLAVAMPYAMHGLSSWVGTGAMSGYHPATGLMAKKGFLGAVGQVGNAIRTGYQATTGAIGNTWSTITKSIGNTFQKFQTGAGNLWTRISNGAKQLFTQSKNTAKSWAPKFRAGQFQGTVGVEGWAAGPQSYLQGQTATMTSGQAMGLVDANIIQGSQLSGQTLGSAEGWFTKAGSSEADKFITETINKAVQPRINMLDKDALRYFNDNVAFEQSAGSHINYSNSLDSVMNNKATTRQFATDFATEPSGYTTNLANTKDYTYHAGTKTYQFTGENTYNNSVGKSAINKVKKSSNIKKGMKYAAGNLAKGLLTQTPDSLKHPNIMYASAADMTQQTTAGYGGTDIQGSWGGSLLQGAFDDNQRERIMNYYKNMNIIGSH